MKRYQMYIAKWEKPTLKKMLLTIHSGLNEKESPRGSCMWTFGPQLMVLLRDVMQSDWRKCIIRDTLQEFIALRRFQFTSSNACLWLKMWSLSFLLWPPIAISLPPILTLPLEPWITMQSFLQVAFGYGVLSQQQKLTNTLHNSDGEFFRKQHQRC